MGVLRDVPKNVLVLSPPASYGAVAAQLSAIHDGLRANGLNSVLVTTEGGILPDAEFAGAPYFVVNMNRKCVLPEGTRQIGFMIDHPCYDMQFLTDADPRDVSVTWTDTTYLPVAEAFSLPFRSSFVAHAGPEPIETPLAMDERDIDLFFSGNFEEAVTRDTWTNRHPGLPPVLVDIIFAAAEDARTDERGIFLSFLNRAAERGLAIDKVFTPDRLSRAVCLAGDLVEKQRRNDIFTNLPKMRLVIAGSGMPESIRNRPGVECLGPVDDFAEIRRLMSRSRIVLNSTSGRPGGSHERIWFAMAEGAVVLNDLSTFLRKDFSHGETILELPQHSQIGNSLDYLADLARDPSTLQAIADRALPIYRDRHTWRTRALSLLDAV